MTIKIPFNQPAFGPEEYQAMAQALENGHISGNGQFSRQCQTLLEEQLSIPKAMLTTSCTHALEMTALLLDIQVGDEVIVPSFTFPTTVSAYTLRGATPVFVDVRADTLNINERLIEQAITEKTKAIVVVHYGGVACEMESLVAIAKKYKLKLIEDNAHGLYGKYKGRFLGTFGCLATQSFHETKNFTCGEGGALLINDEEMIEQAEIIWEKGTDRQRFFRGQVDKYTWVAQGSSYVLSDLLAACLSVQLSRKTTIMAKRKALWNRYFHELKPWADSHDIQLPFVPEECESAYHLFYLILPTHHIQERFIAWMKAQGILCVFHYQPLHLSPMGKKLGQTPYDCEVSVDMSTRLVRLPFYNQLNKTDQQMVIKAVKTFPF